MSFSRPTTALLLLLVFLAGCDATDTREADRCEVFQTCNAEEQLTLTLLERGTRAPANVSLFFKIDTEVGLPVAGLTPANFDIFENEQLVSRFEADQRVLPRTGQFQYSIALLLDLSGSIVKSESLEPLKEAASTFIDAQLVSPGDPRYGEVEVGIWWFDGQETITQLTDFTPNAATLKAGLASIDSDFTVDNSTNLYGAVVQGLAATEQRVEARRADEILAAGSLVLFTDGTDQANRTRRSDALAAVNRAADDASIFTIGLGGEIDLPTLEAIGRNGFVSAANLGELVPKFQEIAGLVRAEANSYYLLEYCSPKRNGTNELTIRATYGDAVGLLSTSFNANDFAPGCSVGS